MQSLQLLLPQEFEDEDDGGPEENQNAEYVRLLNRIVRDSAKHSHLLT